MERYGRWNARTVKESINMNVSGGAVLIVSLAILIFVGMYSIGGTYAGTGINESDAAYHSMEGSRAVLSPIFTLFGYSIMGIGAFLTIRAFNLN
ncbi:hypothetical protein RE474_11445 [Methanolobus sediminis]|uniref:Uncharacterized protein n=1 Tax=Methanolobus sediminis TaxID=3072978 RepID=A0AA51YL86_9EURY|nr:hypothetical protein [Methanolobus sediminis]WMW24687.1 hypothetical protein RE474_11445 [Methanolobus sediminis]